MLAIEVAFLTGRYVATAYNSRAESEWPPHPARLYSALVATHHETDIDSRDPCEEDALRWLETLGPPAIQASTCSERELVNVFVPVNDVALTDVDAEAADVDAAKAELDDARASGKASLIKKAETRLRSVEAKFKKAIDRKTAAPTKPQDPKAGWVVLPEGRVRQPRTFPSVTPTEPRVTYVWAEADAPDTIRSALAAVLRRLVRVGHSSSLVMARLSDTEAEPTLKPSRGGELILRTVQAGQFDALERHFALHKGCEPRVLPAVFERYTRSADAAATPDLSSAFTTDWLVLRRVGGPALPIASCVAVAETVRRALMSYCPEPVPEVLSGHSGPGAPSVRDHLAIIPLPFVGHAHATGAILGVALVFPTEASQDDRRAVYRAVANWEDASRVDDEDCPRLPVLLGSAGVLELERVEWGDVQRALRPSTWAAPASAWSSATPVALDRHPGDMRSPEPEKANAALGEAAATIGRACVRIGLPCPARIEVLPAAPWAGAPKVRQYPPFPRSDSRPRRVLTHARLEFDHPVQGPIILGAGRYLGLGLFRPEFDRD